MSPRRSSTRPPPPSIEALLLELLGEARAGRITYCAVTLLDDRQQIIQRTAQVAPTETRAAA